MHGIEREMCWMQPVHIPMVDVSSSPTCSESCANDSAILDFVYTALVRVALLVCDDAIATAIFEVSGQPRAEFGTHVRTALVVLFFSCFNVWYATAESLAACLSTLTRRRFLNTHDVIGVGNCRLDCR